MICPSCIAWPLAGIPDLKEAGGYAVMRPAMSPFGVDVDKNGYHRYQLDFVIQGLPEPESLGNYSQFVAWVTTRNFTR